MDRDTQNEVLKLLNHLEKDIEWHENSPTERWLKTVKNKVKQLKEIVCHY